MEVDELLSKGAIETSSGGASFYSSVFVGLSVLVASGPYLTLSSLIVICIYLLLRFLLSDMPGSLFNMVTMLSALIFMLIYMFLLLSSSIIFFTICLPQYTMSVKGFTFWTGHSP